MSKHPDISPESMDACEMTVRWLTAKHPEIAPASSRKSWPERLLRALDKMHWMKRALCVKGKHTHKQYLERIDEHVHNWSQAEHDLVVEHIDAGGISIFVDPTKEMPRVLVSPGEEIELELDPADEAGSVIDGLRPKSQRSPDNELEEVVAAAVVAADPRYKVW